MSKRSEHNLEQDFNCTLISEDGRPATPRLEHPVLVGMARIVESSQGPALMFVPHPQEGVESPGAIIPFQWDSFESIGNEFRIVSERERRVYLVKKF